MLEATNKVGSYWIQVRGMHHCFIKDICQVAILKYEGSKWKEPPTPFPSLERFTFTGLVSKKLLLLIIYKQFHIP